MPGAWVLGVWVPGVCSSWPAPDVAAFPATVGAVPVHAATDATPAPTTDAATSARVTHRAR
ncbi:hypothetical protein [Rhodococcus aerolatus]